MSYHKSSSYSYGLPENYCASIKESDAAVDIGFYSLHCTAVISY
jgi:hypothetical protein